MKFDSIISREDYDATALEGWPSYREFLEGRAPQNHATAQQFDQFLHNKIQIALADQAVGNEISNANKAYQSQIYFDKKYTGDRSCTVPWNVMGVSASGNVFICECTAWLTRFVGNIFTAKDVYQDILNSVSAQQIRQEIVSQRYFYCNNFLCSHFDQMSKTTYQTTAMDEASLLPLKFETNPAYLINAIPSKLIFDFDTTCNFRCPSCRTNLINNNKHYLIRNLNNKLVEKIKCLIIDNIQDQPVEIRWAGGEPFISEVYMELMQYCIDLRKSNIMHVIQTNGSYLQKKSDLVMQLLPYIKELRISFDAATESTYQKVRINGVWNTLIDNVIWINRIITTMGLHTKVTADFVVQEDNYREIIPFANLCIALGIKHVNYQKMWNWNTWPVEELEQRQVWYETHSKYHEVENLISQAKQLLYKNSQ